MLKLLNFSNNRSGKKRIKRILNFLKNFLLNTLVLFREYLIFVFFNIESESHYFNYNNFKKFNFIY
jgi:hypothetical protein